MPSNDLARAKGFKGLAIAAILALSVPAAFAGSLEQAKRIHDRIAGVPPSDAVLLQMAADIDGGDPVAAAFRAMDNPNFYNVTLKNFAAPWTNRAESVFVPLNDYIATVIGMVRDDVAFNTLLSADILYVGNGGPAYSVANNDHYQTMDDNGTDLSTALQQTTQSSLNGLPPNATAGIMTTRAAAEAFYVAGTNRAMFRFTMLNHMCNDMEQVREVTRAPDRIRQDVSRSPGGDSRIFLNNCIGCHGGMDGMAGAFAYYDFDEETEIFSYDPSQVASKYFNNDANFEFGYRTTDDSWINYWREGPNFLLGWDQSLPATGNGAKELGQELAGTQAFASCQVTKVFRNVCFRDPTDTADRNQIDAMVASFASSGYRLKQVFAESAQYCMGD